MCVFNLKLGGTYWFLRSVNGSTKFNSVLLPTSWNFFSNRQGTKRKAEAEALEAAKKARAEAEKETTKLLKFLWNFPSSILTKRFETSVHSYIDDSATKNIGKVDSAFCWGEILELVSVGFFLGGDWHGHIGLAWPKCSSRGFVEFSKKLGARAVLHGHIRPLFCD